MPTRTNQSWIGRTLKMNVGYTLGKAGGRRSFQKAVNGSKEELRKPCGSTIAITDRDGLTDCNKINLVRQV